ncbi:ATP-dependent nuclease [Methanococcus maripaludis]|uniref:AAA family ATPase n=1 Tax=Methanococcus maripaludis TaxID=39152 RepID=A0A8T3VYB9_METMI|nr:AAA family ATPase [Methanococcus maripaludis]MBG0769628.1 AAA family ATPase [Methanococcus maripaludis]
MELKSIRIKNFRSIEDQTIEIPDEFEKKCVILLGINGVGKSNILNAIEYMDSKRMLTYSLECCKKSKRYHKDIEFEYLFRLKKDELNDIESKLGVPSGVVLTIGPKISKKVIFSINKPRSDKYNIDDLDVTYIGYHKCANDKLIEIEKSEYDELPNEEKAAISIMKNTYKNEIFAKLGAEFEKRLPKINFWKYQPNYLINETINLNEFKTNPKKSIPLQNIFKLYGITDELWESTISTIMNDDEERVELEVELSTSITEHIRRLWPNHKTAIKLRIEGNGVNTTCKVQVEDEDGTNQRFLMNQRSDGFKQFISILLTISALNKSGDLRNNIIILDEPEIHLHPSGTEYLRDELLNISLNNTVFISTHSIFMIDKNRLDRHIRVDKKAGCTITEQINKDNPWSEDIVYRALGTSIYEIIEPNVIIFEGRTDKDLFDAFSLKFRDEWNPASIKTINASGAPEVPKYVKFFAGNKMLKGYIVVDSDEEGYAVLENVKKQDPEFTNSCFDILNILDDKSILNGKTSVVLEDLLPEELVLTVAKDIFKKDFIGFKPDESIMKFIKRNLNNHQFKTNKELLKSNICKLVIEDVDELSNEKIKEKYGLYYDFAEKLNKKIA